MNCTRYLKTEQMIHWKCGKSKAWKKLIWYELLHYILTLPANICIYAKIFHMYTSENFNIYIKFAYMQKCQNHCVYADSCIRAKNVAYKIFN